MENIFENAWFGKAYKTRDGRKVLFVKNHGVNNKIIYEDETVRFVGNNGRIYANILDKSDIVSEWPEEIDEEKLDKLAQEYIKDKKEPSMRIASYNGFRAGYRKAKE